MTITHDSFAPTGPWPAGVALEVNLRNSLHAGDGTHK